ncbi:unnamed protein product [Staurois parvus]|uniref:Uncharacterized protein n=1 Tax=Staurois parvus TaxID=386267 RepID=A0ABN9ARI3_9NEOB|nr:unnamed protein product [Staurois parvus]
MGGTDGHNPWALTGGTDWQHCGCTAGRNLRVSLLGTDHQGTDHQCPDDRCQSPL